MRRAHGCTAALCIGLVLSMLAGACSSEDSATAGSVVDTSSATAPVAPADDSASGTGVPLGSSDTAVSPGDDPSGDGAPVSAEATVAVLTGAGIAVVDSPEPVVTGAVLTLTGSQAQFLAEEAASGSGLRGLDLDAGGGGATSGLPVSAVLAGYVRGVDTAGAEYARELLADQDLIHPEQVVFPTVVLALFAADAATAFADDEAAGESSLTEPPTAAGLLGGGETRLRRAGICSTVTKGIFDAVDRIFARIHIPPGRVGDTGSSFLNGVLQGLTDIVVAGLNFVIDAAKALIIEGVKYLLDKVLTIVAEVAAVAALVGNIRSAIGLWQLKLTAKDPSTRKGIEPNMVYDQVTATAVILGPSDDWPAWFVDCAAVAGVQLPSLLPIDATVTWKVFSFVPSADLMFESPHEINKDVRLRKEGSNVVAKIGLVTGTESKEKADNGEAQHGEVAVHASARRDQMEKLRKTLVTAVENLANSVLKNVPAFIAGYLSKLVKEAAEGSTEQVASLLDASADTRIDVLYHGPPEPEEKQVPPPVGGEGWSFAFFSEGSIAPTFAGYTCGDLASTFHVIFGAGAPQLERTYDLPFSPSAMTVHHDLIYDLPPAGTSGAVHLEWRWDYFLDTSVSPPMIRISGFQHETPEGQGEFVFENNFGTGDGIIVENTTLPALLEGRGLSHPFLDRAGSACG